MSRRLPRSAGPCVVAGAGFVLLRPVADLSSNRFERLRRLPRPPEAPSRAASSVRYTNRMKFGFVLKHHDFAYVERRGGLLLLTYMRGAPGRADYRGEALDRALAAFDERTATEACAAGLVVLQRALLCAEDLGRLLHALGGPEPWARLRAASLADIDEAFASVTADDGQVRQTAFCLPTRAQVKAEGWDSADQAAFLRLCSLVDARRTRMLASVAGLWSRHSRVAKATMHGLPVLAGEHMIEPPGAGRIGAEVVDPGVPFAVVLSTRASGAKINTSLQTLNMDRPSVASWHREGKVATRLFRDICDVQAASIMGGYGVIVPTELVRCLSADDRNRVERIVGSGGEDERAAS